MASAPGALDVCAAVLVLLWNLLRTAVLWLVPTFLRPRKDVSGQVALVTGAASGLGREMALRLAELGATVVLWDVDLKGAEETRKTVLELGGRAHVYFCDVGDRGTVYKTAELVKSEVGPVDILVNNAGVAMGKSFDELRDEEILKVYDINLLAHYWTLRAFLPDMVQRDRGHVLAVASAAGFVCGPRLSEYSPTKHAVMALMECVQVEIFLKGAGGVRTTTACPFFARTQIYKKEKGIWLPSMGAKGVARTMVDAMLRNEDVVVVPSGLGWMRGLYKNLANPKTMADFLRLSRADKTMEGLKVRGLPSVPGHATNGQANLAQ